MPVIHSSSYRPPLYLHNGHLQTIYPNLFRRIDGVNYRRLRLTTQDHDFLDLDYSIAGSDRIAVITHGLEGSSKRPYILGMVKILNNHGWDAVAWNFRGCSGEPNRNLRFYHSGDTDDLHTVLSNILSINRYRSISLVGFSMGGNIALKYLGERGKDIAPIIHGAVVFSVPCDLRASALKMSRPANAVYMRRFLRMLRTKVRAKMKLFPGRIDDSRYRYVRTFKDFDDRYTAPLHGFESAEDYWFKAGSKPLLTRISVPTLMVNALDDPFLAPECYPYREAQGNPFFFLETPATGGHVGFITPNGNGRYWSETRTVEFLEEHAMKNRGLQSP